MIAWWSAAALAAGVAGTAVPGAGGGFAGPADPGASGLPYQPAALTAAPTPELLVDVGLFHRSLAIRLDDWNEEVHSAALAPQPTLSAAVPVDRFGVGVVFQAPWARGSEQDPAGPQRLFTIRSTLQLLEVDLLAGWSPHPRIRLGGGARLGHVTYRSDKAVDTGLSLNASADPEPPLPAGDPLLQGEQRVGALQGIGVSWVAGATVVLPADVEIHVAVRPRWQVTATGPVEQEPSVDLDAAVRGDASVALGFPAQLTLAGTIPVQRFRFLPEVDLLGWKGAGSGSVTISDLQLQSSDPLFDSVLVASGLAEADFVTASEGTRETQLGWRNSWSAGLQTEWEATAVVTARAGLWVAPHAIPDAVVTPSNLDFASVTARIAGAVRPGRAARIALAADRLFCPVRDIRTSAATDVLPAGNGTYRLGVWRFGASVLLAVGPGRDAQGAQALPVEPDAGSQ